MQAQCACGAASRGLWFNVLSYMRDHNCSITNERDVDLGFARTDMDDNDGSQYDGMRYIPDINAKIGFQPNPLD